MIMDLIVITLIALSTYLGYKKGFIELSVSLVATIIAVILAFIFVTPLTNFIIENTEIDEYIEDILIEKTYSIIKDGEDESNKNELIEQATLGTLTEMASSTSYNIIRISSSLLIYVLVRVVLVFVKGLARLVARIPGIKQIDGIGGTAYGVVRGIVIVYLILLVSRELGNVKVEYSIEEELKSSVVARLMYENNIFNSLVK